MIIIIINDYTRTVLFYKICLVCTLRCCLGNEPPSVVTGSRGETFAGAIGHGSSSYPHKLLESLSEFRIEYCVNHGVDKTVHVPQPRGQYEHPDPGRTVLVQLVADCVQDVTRKKRHPAK